MSNDDKSADVMNQICQGASGIQWRSALSHLAELSASSPTDGESRQQHNGMESASCQVRLGAVSACGLLLMRAREESRESLSTALQSVLNLSLPERLGSTGSDATGVLRWMSPDEWLLSCAVDQAFTIERRLRAETTASLALLNVTGGFCLMTLSGPKADEVMAKSTAYDIHPENFSEGKVVNTLIGKAQVTLRALPERQFEILVRRSLADYLWLWLQRAGREYGMSAEPA